MKLLVLFVIIFVQSNIVNCNIIFPGTKWCGNGNIAINYDDLGTEKDTDICCRQHDHCGDNLSAKESRHGLENRSDVTKLNCDCDMEFRRCLKSNNSVSSRIVGSLYFNMVNSHCYKKEHPIKRCLQYSRNRCTEYELDRTLPKEYQWFDLPSFEM